MYAESIPSLLYMSNKYESFNIISASYETTTTRSLFALPLLDFSPPCFLKASPISVLAFSSSINPILTSLQCILALPARDIDLSRTDNTAVISTPR